MARTVVACLLVCAADSTVRAEKAPSGVAELTAAAALIVTGTVEVIQADRSLELPWEYLRYHALVKIAAVEKGDALAPGDRVGCRYWTRDWLRSATPPLTTNGHWPLPRSGQRVRVYLVADGYNGFGQTTDGGYDVFGRNGWEILSTPAGLDDNGTSYDSLASDWRRTALAVSAGLIGLILIFWCARKRRRR